MASTPSGAAAVVGAVVEREYAVAVVVRAAATAPASCRPCRAKVPCTRITGRGWAAVGLHDQLLAPGGLAVGLACRVAVGAVVDHRQASPPPTPGLPPPQRRPSRPPCPPATCALLHPPWRRTAPIALNAWVIEPYRDARSATLTADGPYAHPAMRTAILTVSTSVAAGQTEDRSGAALAEHAQAAGAEIVARDVLPDDRAAIEDWLRAPGRRGRVADLHHRRHRPDRRRRHPRGHARR